MAGKWVLGLFLIAVLSLAGCGSGGGTKVTSIAITETSVKGIAATGTALANATVTLIDAKGAQKSDTTKADGSYSFTVTTLSAPFVIKVDAGSQKVLYSFTGGPGTANVNPFSDLIVRAAANGTVPDTALTTIKTNIASAKEELKTNYQAMLTAYSVASDYDPIASAYTIGNALDKLFDSIGIVISGVNVTITNARNQTVVYTGSIALKSTVTLNEQNIPQPIPANNIAPIATVGTAQQVITGTVVTLDGSASSDANSDTLTYSWSFDSKPDTSTSVLSSTSASKPTFTPDVAGDYVVKLVVSDGWVKSAEAKVTVTAVVPVPTITSISPTFGPPGQRVFVSGTNFMAGNTQVSLGDISVVPDQVASPTQLSFVVPVSATGANKVKVETQNGTAESAEMFTVGTPTGPPTITNVATTFGLLGQWVYVYGTNFVNGNTTVTLGSTALIPATVYGPTQLGFAVPAEVSGSSKVTVVTPNGTVTSTGIYSWNTTRVTVN